MKNDNVKKAFSRVKVDIHGVRSKLNDHLRQLENLDVKVKDFTTKSEFYDFIRELNDELKKLEKHIATQDSLERLRMNLNIQLKDLKQDIKERQKINKNLEKIDDLEAEFLDVQEKLDGIKKYHKEHLELKKDLETTKKSFVNRTQFFEKVKEISEEDKYDAIENLKEELEDDFDDIYKDIEKNKKAFLPIKKFDNEVSKINKKLDLLISEKKELQKTIKTQQKEITLLKKKAVLPKKSNNEEKISLFWPVLIIILFITVLIVGLFAWGDSLLEPETYDDVGDIVCQEKFDCEKVGNNTFLTDCYFDDELKDCHCNAKDNAISCQQ